MRTVATRVLALLVVCLAAGFASASAQVSPGPLAEAHRDLEGQLDCFKCHARKGSMDERCLDCHTEVAWMRTQRRGYHARVTDRACAKCHPDHGGRGFQLVVWDGGSPEAFDHRLSGWALEGKHAALECRACHQTKFRRSAVARLIKRRDPARSWLGLEIACASCHADPHRGQLGPRCERCHGQRAWSPAPGFDHAKSDYPLTGAHLRVACEKCHLAPAVALPADAAGHPVPRYKPLDHRECAPCHRDPHAGRFGAGCARCHNTEDFTTVNARGFNHDLTRYPLRGRHAAVECARCHDPRSAWGKTPRFDRCDACHRDAHAGLATIAGRPADCAACHTVAGFHPSTFTVAQHRASRYPLEGAHARADCSLCHARLEPGGAAIALGAARVVMRPAAGQCVDCHRDPHRGRFATGGERAQARGCVTCHGLETFRPASVDVAAHARSRFALDGAHRAVPCQACHAELRSPPRASTLRAAADSGRALRFIESFARCVDCHADPHGGQFAERRDGGACEACHGLEAFAPASRFDHDRGTRFRLEGAHERVACARCHRTVRDPSGRARVVYRPLDPACESCHASGLPSRTKRTSLRMGAADGMRSAAAAILREVSHVPR